MSIHLDQKRITVPSLRAMKNAGKIVMLTAYTTPMAKLLDPHCDVLLVRKRGQARILPDSYFRKTYRAPLKSLFNK